MKILNLKVRVLTPGILSSLARKGLVRPLVPTHNVLRCRSSKGTVGTIYASKARHGTHKLISVRCTTGPVRLNSHEDNEEFILIHPRASSLSPLYMIIGLHKHAVIQSKARKGILSRGDFMALKLVFNDPVVSIFTMLKDTPHFEIAAGGRRQAPIFFVTEPSRLRLHMVKLGDYRLALEGQGA